MKKHCAWSLYLHACWLLGWAFEYFSDLLLVDRLSGIVEFELVFGAPHAEYLEAIDLWYELWSGRQRLIEVLHTHLDLTYDLP